MKLNTKPNPFAITFHLCPCCDTPFARTIDGRELPLPYGLPDDVPANAPGYMLERLCGDCRTTPVPISKAIGARRIVAGLCVVVVLTLWLGLLALIN